MARHGIGTDTRYLLVRTRTGLDCARIAGIWLALHDSASTCRPRGGIGRFSAAGYAAFAGLAVADVQAAIDAFEAEGMIVDGVIADWQTTQAKTTDRTVAERVKRHRAKKKAPAETTPAAPETDVTAVTQSAVTDETVLEEKERISFSDASTQERDFHTPLGQSSQRALTPGEVWSKLPEVGIHIPFLKRTFAAGTVRAWLDAGLTGAQLEEAARRALAARKRTHDPSPVNLGFLSVFVSDVLAGKPAHIEGGSHAAVDAVAQRYAAGR